MRLRHVLTVLVLAAAMNGPLAAAPAQQADPTAVKISAKIRAMMGVQPDSVEKAPVKGLYEVVINRSRLFYVDAEVKHLIAGRIFDAATETDLTAARMEELSRIDWKTLPVNDAVKVVYGKGERKIAVFTDAKCTYCQLLEKSLRDIGNVTVYNFIYPILNSREAARRIICAKNPGEAYQRHMLNGETPENMPACDASKLDRNLELGRKYGITATPTIVFADGSRFSGAMPIDQLRRVLENQK